MAIPTKRCTYMDANGWQCTYDVIGADILKYEWCATCRSFDSIKKAFNRG